MEVDPIHNDGSEPLLTTSFLEISSSEDGEEIAINTEEEEQQRDVVTPPEYRIHVLAVRFFQLFCASIVAPWSLILFFCPYLGFACGWDYLVWGWLVFGLFAVPALCVGVWTTFVAYQEWGHLSTKFKWLGMAPFLVIIANLILWQPVDDRWVPSVSLLTTSP